MAKRKEAAVVEQSVVNEEKIQEVIEAVSQEVSELSAPKRYPYEVKHDEMMQKAVAFAQAMNDGETDQEVIKAHKKNLKNAVAAYNLELSHYYYRKWNEEGNPVLKAITVRFVPDAVTVKIVKDEESGFYAPEESTDVEMKISLPDMQNVLGKGVFAESNWVAKCNKLAFLYADKIARNLKATEGFKYKINDAAKEFEFSEEYGSVYSNAFFNHALQCVFDSILFVPDEDGSNKIKVIEDYDDNGVPYSPEWTYVTACFTKQGMSVGQVLLGNLAKMAELVADTMYLSMNHSGSGYVAEKARK